MKGFIARTMAAACFAGCLAAAGCAWVGDAYDRCWPQRYNHTARRSVVDGFAPQVQNGHVLDQTVWNYHFETGTEKLNAGGMAKLDQIVRHRPHPDPNLFLATARDIAYDPAEPEKYAETRRDLDLRRIASMHKYLQAQTVGRPMQFDVQIHDPYPVGQPGVSAANQARQYQSGTTVGGGGAGAPAGTAATTQQTSGGGTTTTQSTSTSPASGTSGTTQPRQ